MTRRHTRSKAHRIKLTQKETITAAQRMMAGAQAHQRTSVWCADKPDAKPPNIDWFFFTVVSLELILMSIEQSLRLVLLLHYSIVREDTNHTPHVLYQAMRRESGGEKGIRSEIVKNMNMIGTLQGLMEFSEGEIVSCLKQHRSSYGNFRYFQLSHQGTLNPDFGFTTRDRQILHCLALGLIAMNVKEMQKRRIRVIESMSVVPESEMTDELKALKDKLRSQS